MARNKTAQGGISLRSRVTAWLAAILLVTMLSTGIATMAGQWTVRSFDTLLADNAVCYTVQNALKDEAQAMQLFRQQGLHFTMQQVAEPLHISKKTIYTVYPSKEALLLDMVDHAFAEIHRCKQEILAGSGTLQEKLRAVIIAMPAEYAALDLRQMKELDEKYPVVAARVRSQLENGWEPTMTLLEQAVAEGVMRPVSLPVLRQMITASIESFLADRSLAESGVQYVAVLEEMISILLEGVLPR